MPRGIATCQVSQGKGGIGVSQNARLSRGIVKSKLARRVGRLCRKIYRSYAVSPHNIERHHFDLTQRRDNKAALISAMGQLFSQWLIDEETI
jgi:hypothetical protein